ncbi:hypothetical protein SAMN05421858_0087 [Haladaptatus litoreus]|uniref:Uncharacterized protein n=1 Tax=Haladaptatus litoreus TaxID=553468 RepID=A0A1N6UT63_9EURY|nr:hypothetical protein SAMN05421858_0087 [Haladaptatus litoreus]
MSPVLPASAGEHSRLTDVRRSCETRWRHHRKQTEKSLRTLPLSTENRQSHQSLGGAEGSRPRPACGPGGFRANEERATGRSVTSEGVFVDVIRSHEVKDRFLSTRHTETNDGEKVEENSISAYSPKSNISAACSMSLSPRPLRLMRITSSSSFSSAISFASATA